MIGKKAPAFTLMDLNGKKHSLKDYKDQIIWLEFWVTWCGACQETLPKKDVFFRSLRHPRLTFLTIHVTGRDPYSKQLKEFVEQAGYQFPILCDHERQTYDAYGITSVPTTVLIDSNGLIYGMYDETVPFTHIIQEVGTLITSTETDN